MELLHQCIQDKGAKTGSETFLFVLLHGLICEYAALFDEVFVQYNEASKENTI